MMENGPMSATTVSSLAWFRAASRTLKPALASWIANSRPMPSDAPVTTRRFALMTRIYHPESCGQVLTCPCALIRTEFFELWLSQRFNV